MSLPVIALSVCLLVIIGSLIACRFDLLRPPAKWVVPFASASAFIGGLLLLTLDRDGDRRLIPGFVLNENCPPTDQVAVTSALPESNRIGMGNQEEDGIRRRIATAKAQEAEATQRAEMAKAQEDEAWQRAKMAKAEEAAARGRAQMANLQEREMLRQVDTARAEALQSRQAIDMAKIQEADARERASNARKEEAEARERAERAKAELIEAKNRTDAAQAEAQTGTRKPQPPVIIRGGRKLSVEKPM